MSTSLMIGNCLCSCYRLGARSFTRLVQPVVVALLIDAIRHRSVTSLASIAGSFVLVIGCCVR